MELPLWALLSLMVSLVAGAFGFSHHSERGRRSPWAAELTFAVFLAVFVVLVALTVAVHG